MAVAPARPRTRRTWASAGLGRVLRVGRGLLGRQPSHGVEGAVVRLGPTQGRVPSAARRHSHDAKPDRMIASSAAPLIVSESTHDWTQWVVASWRNFVDSGKSHPRRFGGTIVPRDRCSQGGLTGMGLDDMAQTLTGGRQVATGGFQAGVAE